MELKFELFPDMIGALGKIGAGLAAAVDIPKKERDKYRQAMKETYRLIDTHLNMVILRLGDIQLFDDDRTFMQEVTKLDNYAEWRNAEREFRLCENLRATYSEAERLRGKLVGSRSVQDWDALLEQMRDVFSGEHEAADYISTQFKELADAAWTVRPPKAVRKQVKDMRDSLIQEREKLIRQETEMYAII